MAKIEISRRLRERLAAKSSRSLALRGFANALLAFLTAMLVFSQARLSDVVQKWFSSCMVVVDLSSTSDETYELALHFSGDLPSAIPASFVALDGRNISLIRMLGGAARPEGGTQNLNQHPQAGFECPSETFCQAQSRQSTYQIRIAPISANFDYRYAIGLEKRDAKPSGRLLHVYLNYSGEKEGFKVCRAEPPGLLNAHIWLPRWSSLILLAAVIFLFATLIQFVRKHGGEA